MKYYVKAPVSGWHEVSKESYEKFVQHIRDGATALELDGAEDYIKCVTKVETL